MAILKGKVMDRILAAGSRDEYGQVLQEKQDIIFKISRQLNQAGFTPIKTSLIERQSTFDRYPGTDMFHLYDQAGENLVLRPDMTLPVARFIETHYRSQAPNRLYYIDDVFRKTDYLSGDYNQETQARIELIGDASLGAEQKAIEIMLNLAANFNLGQLEIVLGDASLIDTILASFPALSNQQRQALKKSIEQKNLSRFQELTKHLPDLPAVLTDWPLAFGQRGEEILPKLGQIPAVKPIIIKWQKIADFIHQHFPNIKVTVDLAGQAPQPYYTGTMIQGFLPDLGETLFSGGRYDCLLKNFQGDFCPALGMGLNIQRLMAAQKQPAKGQHPIVVVLAKGRVEEDVRPLLQAAGIDTSPLEHPGRRLIFESADHQFRFILVKPTDVLKYLDRGIGDIGVVGSDTTDEQEQNHYDVLDLKRGQAEFVVAAPAGFNLNNSQRHRIATKYPKRAGSYFNSRGQDVELIKLEGSVELGPLTGLADAIMDISQTGNTLEANQLEVYDTVCQVSTHLLVRRGALWQHQQQLTKVIEALINELKGV